MQTPLGVQLMGKNPSDKRAGFADKKIVFILAPFSKRKDVDRIVAGNMRTGYDEKAEISLRAHRGFEEAIKHMLVVYTTGLLRAPTYIHVRSATSPRLD